MYDNCSSEDTPLLTTSSLLINLVFILLAVSICGGNILTIVAVWIYPVLQTIPNMYVVALAVADLLVGAVVIPFQMILALSSQDVRRNETFCLVNNSIFFVSLSSSIIFMTYIAVDRACYIGYPLHYQRLATVFKAKLFILLGWTTALVFTTVPIVFRIKWGECTTCTVYEAIDNDFKIYGQVGAYVFTSIWMCVCYGYIFRIARRHQKQCMLDNIPGARSKLDNDMKLIKLFLLVFGVYFLCWLPGTVVLVTAVYVTRVSEDIFNVTLLLGLLNSAMNFLIYGIKNEDFRKVFRKMLWRKNRIDGIV